MHGPTSQLVRYNFSILESFYNDISTVLNALKNKSLVFLTRDWNVKVGKKIKQNASDNCIGSFASGVRNNSGQHLIASTSHCLVICKLQVEKYNIFKNANKTNNKSYNTFQLIKSEETRNVYQQQFHENLWENIQVNITDAATKILHGKARAKLIDILESFLREDEMHIIRILFSNTTLDIK